MSALDAVVLNRTIKTRIFFYRQSFLLLVSIVLQLSLGLFFGHVYDMRIFMATGYLVATGQNPYIPQDLSFVFNNPSFQGITTIGYPPPWSLVLGILYWIGYSIVPNLLIYNLVIKIPIIAANIYLAYLTERVLNKLGASPAISRRAWIFMIFNPLLIYCSAAWGQFDSMVALLALLAIVSLSDGSLNISTILLALAISCKPTALPLVPVFLIYLKGKSTRRTIQFIIIFIMSMILFCIVPFYLFSWDPSPIVENWNAHFTVGGGLSFMSFYELINGSYKLPGMWWLLGMIWIPALGIGFLVIKKGITDLEDLIRKSAGMILLFFITRSWVSEPNLILVLPLGLILTSLGTLPRTIFTAIWLLPLAFSIFNASLPQLFFPSMPDLMSKMLDQAESMNSLRIIIRTIVVIPWLACGWWVVIKCLRTPLHPGLQTRP